MGARQPGGGGGGGGGSQWGQESTAKFAGSGSPVGVVTPTGEGDLYVDSTTPGLWQATGVTSADWAQIGGSQPVGCVLSTSTPVDGFNGGFFVWDSIADNPYDNNPLDDLPDGIGIDPDSVFTDTLVTTAAGVWAFTVDAIGVPADVTFTGEIVFGNMNISPIITIPVQTSGSRIISSRGAGPSR